ncbi:hypothetical protein UG55_105439 [Frankia sp. EI5c]|uniref:DUF1330 domain-containing protein n=1 Tax=Frankia sp. EI5c TaxID=683316 RepID=UPI0007C2A80B|nr:DUF1330 domain-containing protein [Frankia sp. EI5c]OAA21776.1 hypothetical protein UG55_105439 [Frankia sp. EI5c]
MAVNPSSADLQRLDERPLDEPVVMLNLLRFRPDGGRESYDEYSRRARKVLARYGGELVYLGAGSTVLIAEPGQEWDAVLLIRYPSRAAFLNMVADPEYQETVRFRTEALTEAVLQATIPAARG